MTTKNAIIIIPNYPAPYTLPTGPGNRNAFINMLASRGYANINVIEGYLTRSSIINSMNSFVASCSGINEKDTIIWCGHGSRLPGNETDGWDECFVSSDIQGIRDNEFKVILQSLKNKGAIIDVVSEFCYSGTSTDSTNFRTWCACGPSQTAWWGYSAGIPIGLFTGYLCYYLNKYPTIISSDLITLVKNAVSASVPTQRPQLDGGPIYEIPF